MRSMFMVLTLAILAGGCKKKEPETATPEPAPAAPAPAPAPALKEKGPIIDPVHFETGSTAIGDGQAPAIDRAAEILKTTDWTCLVVGLSDASGDDEANKVLSQQRADAVAAALLAKAGVSESRVKAHGIGEKLATATTVNERKVEFVFYVDTGLPPKQVVIDSRVLEDDFRAKKNE